MEPREYEALARNETEFWWHRSLRETILAELQAAGCAGARRWADIGCGAGGALRHLREKGFESGIGVDLSEHAALFWDPRIMGGMCRGDANRLPFKSDTLDFVLSIDVLYHSETMPDKCLAETHRVLKKGGCLFLTSPAYGWLRSAHDRAVHGARRFRRGQLAGMVRHHGFSVLRATYLFPTLLPFLALHRCLTKGRTNEESEVRTPLRTLNQALYLGLGWERRWLRAFNFPAGSTILVVARKN